MPVEYAKNDDGHFVCTHKDCNKVFERQNTMYYHIMRHRKQFAYTCADCDKGFIQKSAFLHHMAAIHPGNEITIPDRSEPTTPTVAATAATATATATAATATAAPYVSVPNQLLLYAYCLQRVPLIHLGSRFCIVFYCYCCYYCYCFCSCFETHTILCHVPSALPTRMNRRESYDASLAFRFWTVPVI